MFDMIHGDVWGPYRVPTFDGKIYFLTLVDNCSRMVWVFLLKLKSDVSVIIKEFLLLVKTQFNSTIKIFRTNNGAEFFNSHCVYMFSNAGIISQRSCVHTPQKNGFAERKHRQILEVARGIRFQGSILLRFWGLCIHNVIYVFNRIPSTALTCKSPFEVFFGKKPNLQYLRVLGCLCFATNSATKRDKFGAKAYAIVHLGYSTT